MASKESCILLACFFAKFFVIGSATSCYYSYSCSYKSGEKCCSDNICRKTCDECYYDYDCSSRKVCCSGNCLSKCGVSGGVIAGSVVSVMVFLGSIISIVACYFCACCPYYRHRSQGRVMAFQPGQQGNQPFVTTTQMSAMQQMQQHPPQRHYNQPPTGYAQPPLFYPSYPQKPTQHPPLPAQDQPPVPPPVNV